MRLFLKLLVLISVWLPNRPEAQTTVKPDDITIVRDQWGLPHVYAPTDAGAAYGGAWAQCEDNFEVIQQTYLFSKGLLGRTYGKNYAAGDFYSALLGIDELLDENMEKDVSPQFMKVLEGYCGGINAYAEAHPEEVLHKKLFPIGPKDVLKSYPLKISQFIGVSRAVSRIVNGSYDEEAQIVEFLGQKGSNAFAYSKKMTDNGRTFLIANPHISMRGAEAFYEIHMVSDEGLNFHGAMFPGSVTPQIGTTPNLGWTHTNNYYDHTDVFVLKMHPTEKLMYEFDGEWIKLEEAPIKLSVKLKALPFPIGVKRKAYISKYGPTLESENGTFFSIRNPTFMTIKVAEQWYRMNKATDLASFKKALEWNGLPYFNITYADKEDNIFYIFNGLFPDREPGIEWLDLVPGNSSKTLWTDYLPLAERPQIENPDCGYVYNVNHSPFKCTCREAWPDRLQYDTLVSFDRVTDDLPRSLRFREIYTDGTKLSMEELKRIKYDVQFPQQHYLTSAIRQLAAVNDPAFTELTDQLQGWNYDFTLEQTAPVVAALGLIGLGRERVDIEEEEGQIPEAKLKAALSFAKAHMQQHYGSLSVPFKEFSRVKRGDKEIPMYGFRSTLGARFSRLDSETGKLYATGGDSFMMFIQYNEDGVEHFESIVPFGSSNRPGSAHYADQLELFGAKGAKELTFDKEKIKKNAERIYNPK